MSKVQAICDKLANYMEQELKLDRDQKAVIAYGLFAMIHTSLAMLTSMILGAIGGVLIPTLIISLMAIILRKYSGGAHASNPEECAIIGIIVAVGGGLLLKSIHWYIETVVIIGILLFTWAFYLLYQLAPVENKAKPIKKAEKRIQLKKKSYFVLSLALLMVIFLLVRYSQGEEANNLLYVTCIYVGIGWQIFTLTKIGHLMIQKLDFLFNKLTRNKGGTTHEET